MPFLYPHYYTPTPEAQRVALALMTYVREYMREHPDSELHIRGKMFGVLVCEPDDNGTERVLWAFSALLDGTCFHDGFVPPVYPIDPAQFAGKSPDESRRLQHEIFSHYTLQNARGEERSLLDIFRDEVPLLSPDDYYHRTPKPADRLRLPPAGAGECCAPKLLQEAYRRGWTPRCMAEFWMGASPKDEIRRQGQFYPACLAKCRPILRHMLRGIDVAENPLVTEGRARAQHTRILWEDPWLMAVNKPGGLLAVSGRDGQYALTDFLRDTRPDTPLFPIHRLDMDTSGLLLLAKDQDTFRLMQQLFVSHQISKRYLAVVQTAGEPLYGEGVITLPLLPNPLDRPRQMVDFAHGKRAVTHWRVLGAHPRGTLIELRPETGRTHQLRVHAAHPDGLNAPIVGDRLYGSAPASTAQDSTTPNLLLHAAELTFQHPHTGETCHLTSDPDWLYA